MLEKKSVKKIAGPVLPMLYLFVYHPQNRFKWKEGNFYYLQENLWLIRGQIT